MKLINSSFEILEQEPGLQGIYKQIELAGRTCYKSLDKITKDSAKGFVDRMINSKHYAMLEHGTVYLKIPKVTYAYDHYVVACLPDDDFFSNSYELAYRPYTKVNIQEGYIYVTTNLRVLQEHNWLDDLKYLCEPTEYHEKRITVRFVTSNGIAREFTRHRVFSFAQESTRYCNYTNQAKFGNELTYIHNSDEINIEQKDVYERIERCYKNLIASGMKPQMARDILPLALKTELIMTGFVSDWEYLFRLRTSFIAETGKPHPDMSNLCDPLYKEFIKRGFIEK